VATLVRRLNATTAAIESDAAPALAELRGALVAGRDAARTLDATTAAVGTEVASSASAFRGTADDLRAILREPAWRSLGNETLAAVEDVRRAIAKLDGLAATVERIAEENRADIRAAIDNLKRASGEMRAAARHVREQPASLLVEHPPVEKPIPDPLPLRESESP
jgi:hypothetical protein